MNKKTCAVAVVFMIATLVWLGVNIYWAYTRDNCVLDLIIAILFAAAGIGMVVNESKKRRRRHICDVYKNKIP